MRPLFLSAPAQRHSGFAGLLTSLFVFCWALMAGASPAAAQSYSLFAGQTPASDNNSDSGTNYELGLRFWVDTPGTITGIRYYRSSSDTGSHTGTLWASDGTVLATIAFTNETGSGWQEADFSTPVSVSPITFYTVSVNINAYYPDTLSGLATAQSNGPLHVLVDPNDGTYNPTSGSYPTQSYSQSNYYRDVVFSPGTALPAVTPWIHRGYLGWIRDLASQPTPYDTWPSITVDNQLIADYQTAASEMAASGTTEFEIWGLAAAHAYATNVESTNDSTRSGQIAQIINALHAQGIKVVAGMGGMSWGFDQIIADNPSISCPNTPQVANPTVDLSWSYQYRIIDYLFSLGVDGITEQSADQGRCACGPACDNLGSDIAYHAYIGNTIATYIRQNHANAIVGSANYGAFIKSADDISALQTWTANMDYFGDVGPTVFDSTSGLRQQIINGIGPATYGGEAAPSISPPQHWDRTRWFLPTTQHATANLQSLYNDGALSAENYMHILANPGDEATALVISRLETTPSADWSAIYNSVLDQIYLPTSTDAHNSLRSLFDGAESSFFNNQSGDNNGVELEPLVASCNSNGLNCVGASNPGYPEYVASNMNAGQRAAYRSALVSLQSQAQGLMGQVGNATKMQTIINSISEVIADIDSVN